MSKTNASYKCSRSNPPPAIERYRNKKDGTIGVIVGTGHGAYGWTTELDLDQSIRVEAYLLEVALFDKESVAALLANGFSIDKIRRKFARKRMLHKILEKGEPRPGDLAVAWVKEGVKFRLREDLALETIRYKTDDEWFVKDGAEYRTHDWNRSKMVRYEDDHWFIA
ncbi:hypothetical protein ACLMJK_003589 [Lecanora helva]